MATKKVATSLDLLFNELKNFKVDSLSAAPEVVATGRVYFNTHDNTLYYATGGKWNPIATGGSVDKALKSLHLYCHSENGTTYNMSLYMGEGPTGDNLFGQCDVTDMMKDSSVVSIVSFLPSEGTSPSEGRIGGVYNDEKKTFTTTGGVIFNDVPFISNIYLGLILDNYGGKFGNISNRYVGLAIDSSLFTGINKVVADRVHLHLKDPSILRFGNTDEVKAAASSGSNSDIEFSINKISADKIVHKDWTSDDSDATITPTDTWQDEINEDLRDKANRALSLFDELSLEILDDRMYFTHGDGEKINENGFDVSDFLKDGMLLTVTQTFKATSASQSVLAKDGESYTFTGLKVGTPYIGFVWETREGQTQTVALDVTDLFNAYKEGNGLSLSGDTFSVKIDETGDSYLSVSSAGVKLTGVKSAINGLSGGIKNHDDTIKTHTTNITSLQSNVSSLNSDVSRINKHRSKYLTVPAGTSSESITEDGYAIRNVRFFQLSGTDGSYDEIEVSVLQNGLPNSAAQSVVVSWSGISVTAAKPAFITYEVVPISE